MQKEKEKTRLIITLDVESHGVAAGTFGVGGIAFVFAFVVSAHHRQVEQRPIKRNAIISVGFLQLFDGSAIAEPFVSHFRRIGPRSQVDDGRLAFDHVHAIIAWLLKLWLV